MHKHVYLLVAMCVLLFATPAFAVDDFYGPESGGGRGGSHVRHGGGNSNWEESYSQELDVQAFMDRLYTVLTSPEHVGNIKEVASVAQYLKNMGLFNLSGMTTEYSISGDDMDFWASCEYAGLDPQSYYGKLLALPNNKLASAKFVGEDDHLLYLALNNVPQIIMLELDELGKLQESGGEEALGELLSDSDMGDIGQVLGMVKALKLDETLLSSLSGELAIVAYGVPDFAKIESGDIQPADVDVCLMLGLNGAEFIDGLIAQFGAQAGLQAQEAPGGWKGYNMNGEESIGLVYNDDLLVLSPSIAATVKHMGEAGGGIRVPECQAYFSLNCTAFNNQVLVPLLGLAANELEGVDFPLATAAYLVDLPAPEALGRVTVLSSYGGDSYQSEMHAQKALTQYLAYYAGVAICAGAQVAMQEHMEEMAEPAEEAAAPEADVAPEAPAAPEAAPEAPAE